MPILAKFKLYGDMDYTYRVHKIHKNRPTPYLIISFASVLATQQANCTKTRQLPCHWSKMWTNMSKLKDKSLSYRSIQSRHKKIKNWKKSDSIKQNDVVRQETRLLCDKRGDITNKYAFYLMNLWLCSCSSQVEFRITIYLVSRAFTLLIMTIILYF